MIESYGFLASCKSRYQWVCIREGWLEHLDSGFQIERRLNDEKQYVEWHAHEPDCKTSVVVSKTWDAAFRWADNWIDNYYVFNPLPHNKAICDELMKRLKEGKNGCISTGGGSVQQYESDSSSFDGSHGTSGGLPQGHGKAEFRSPAAPDEGDEPVT